MTCPQPTTGLCSSGSPCPVDPPSTSGSGVTDCIPFHPGLNVFTRLIVAGDFKVFGLGTRNTGGGLSGDSEGTVTIEIPQNTHVVLAYLYWNVVAYDSVPANVVMLDSYEILGTGIGVGPHTCWSNYGPGHSCNQPNCSTDADSNLHNRIYWADISQYIQPNVFGVQNVVLSAPEGCFSATDPFGNPIVECGAYVPGCRGMMPGYAATNGMTIVVVYELNDPPTTCDQVREVIIAHGLVVLGQDQSCGQIPSYRFPFRAQFTGKPEIQFVIGDAQTSWSDSGIFNGAVINRNDQIAPNDSPDGAEFPAGANQGLILATPFRDWTWPISAYPVNYAEITTGLDCLAWHVFCYSATDCRCKVHVNLIPDGPGFEVQNEEAVSLGCQNVNVAYTDNCGALDPVNPVYLIVNDGDPQAGPVSVMTGDKVKVQVNPVSTFSVCTSTGPTSECQSLGSSTNGGGGGSNSPMAPSGGGLG